MLAAHIAQNVRERQGGLRAEVSVTARYPQTVTTPKSGLQTQEIYTLFGTAVASLRGTRTLTGVQAQGMTACPCAQEMVAGVARERLAESGFDADQVEAAIEAVPIATHNQRGIGTLHIGCPEGGPSWIDAPELLRIVETSMSSEIYELMKRPDELSVVEKAHAQSALRRGLRAGVPGFDAPYGCAFHHFVIDRQRIHSEDRIHVQRQRVPAAPLDFELELALCPAGVTGEETLLVGVLRMLEQFVENLAETADVDVADYVEAFRRFHRGAEREQQRVGLHRSAVEHQIVAAGQLGALRVQLARICTLVGRRRMMPSGPPSSGRMTTSTTVREKFE